MTVGIARRLALASAVAISIAFGGISAAAAQEYGSAVTVGGGTTGVGNGDVAVVAPGVTISGGDVSNATGIGIDSGGGSSIGTTTGGDNSLAALQ